MLLRAEMPQLFEETRQFCVILYSKMSVAEKIRISSTNNNTVRIYSFSAIKFILYLFHVLIFKLDKRMNVWVQL